MNRVVLASGNAGKLRELRALLRDAGLECVAQAAFGVPAVVEDGLTFVENALKKARNASRHAGLPSIADDSGLEVAALDGCPGIHSARYAGAAASDADNVTRLLKELEARGVEDRGARFVCVLVYLRHAEDPAPVIATGVWNGSILTAPRGVAGFGYDPVFLAAGLERSAAELTREEKNAVSHRARALRCLRRKMGEMEEQSRLAPVRGA